MNASGFEIKENKSAKAFSSEQYNYVYDKTSGFFIRWGKEHDDDPDYSPYGPEILDLEISSGGDCLGNCPFCYKCNGGDQPTHNMTLDEFNVILQKMPPTLTQIAFGIMNIGTNPDFFPMMRAAREAGIVPNYTCHGLDVTDEAVKETAEFCGAVAVSVVDKERTYDAVEAFSKAGMKQVNIHFMLAEETIALAMNTVDDIASDPRLSGLNAIVFLQYKPKGRSPEAYTPIVSVDSYRNLMAHCGTRDIRYGFDSCSAPLFFKAIANNPNNELMLMMAEPCESGLFSSYINCHGEFFPCSFSEGEAEWSKGINVLEVDDFCRDVWFSNEVCHWRENLISSSKRCECKFSGICRSCPIFDVTSCKKEGN